jgi:hypothetical protein
MYAEGLATSKQNGMRLSATVIHYFTPETIAQRSNNVRYSNIIFRQITTRQLTKFT